MRPNARCVCTSHTHAAAGQLACQSHNKSTNISKCRCIQTCKHVYIAANSCWQLTSKPGCSRNLLLFVLFDSSQHCWRARALHAQTPVANPNADAGQLQPCMVAVAHCTMSIAALLRCCIDAVVHCCIAFYTADAAVRIVQSLPKLMQATMTGSKHISIRSGCIHALCRVH